MDSVSQQSRPVLAMPVTSSLLLPACCSLHADLQDRPKAALLTYACHKLTDCGTEVIHAVSTSCLIGTASMRAGGAADADGLAHLAYLL